MALSQKHVGKYVVPWFCSAEWSLVFEKIYGEDHSRKTRTEALEILNIWKSRTPLLPRGVEGTYIILEAHLLNRSVYDSYNIQLLLSTSIMRFLNICATNDSKHQGTFYQTATRINLPEWLINLRHDMAHGQTLPSLYTLDNGMRFCLEWLNREYWLPALFEMKDFVDDTEFASDKYEHLKTILQPLVSNYCYSILVTHSHWNIQFVRDIVDEETRNSFLEELKLLTDNSDINENIAFTTIQKVLWQHIAGLLETDDVLKIKKTHILPELLIKENIFLGDFDEHKHVFNNIDNNEIPLDFLNLWEKLLIIMQRLNMIEPLIEQLLKLLSINELKHQTKLCAALWLREIGKGLLKCIFTRDLTEQFSLNPDLSAKQIRRDVQTIINAKYKTRNVLNFNYNLPIPDITTNIIKFKTLLLEEPNEYTKIFLSEYLDLNEVFKCREHKTQILDLVNIYTCPGVYDDEETIYEESIHDVEEFMDFQPSNTSQKEMNELDKKEKDVDTKRWRKITEFNFEKCPIGILPWQESTMNPLLKM